MEGFWVDVSGNKGISRQKKKNKLRAVAERKQTTSKEKKKLSAVAGRKQPTSKIDKEKQV